MRSKVSLTGQLASVDEDLTGRENLVLIGRLLGLGTAGAQEPRRPAARGFRPRRGRHAARQELLGRHAPAPGHRRQHRHHPRADVPRRADDRPRSAFAKPGLGHRPRAWSARERRSCSAPSTSTRPTSSADGIAVIDRGKVIAEGTPGQLKASVGSGALHVRLLRSRAARRGGGGSSSGPWARSTARPTRPRCPLHAPTPTAAPRPSPSSRGRHRDRRLLARPAQPRRGLPGPHRAHAEDQVRRTGEAQEEKAA